MLGAFHTVSADFLSTAQKTQPEGNGRETEAAPPSLLFSTVDLTRCCCTQENYDQWMAVHGLPLGSDGVAHYLARAAQVLEEQSYAALFRQEPFDEWAARELFADRLMEAAPLSREELQAAARTSLHEARTDTASVRPCHP